MLWYLASPYTGYISPTETKKDKIMEEAFNLAVKGLHDCLKEGLLVFSPIVHSHPPALYGDLPKDWAFWGKLDMQYIDHCKGVIVYMLDGWNTSTGVQEEIKYALEQGKPVLYKKAD